MTLQYRRPQPPDMLPDGRPEPLKFRKHRYSSLVEPTTEPVTRKSFPRQIIRFLLGRGFLLTVAVIILTSCLVIWNSFIVPWWQGIQVQWQYGQSKITQYDQNVGHQGISHFVAEWHNHQIIVFELPLDNPQNSHIYTIGGFLGQDSEIVTLSFADENRDGKLDMVIGIEGTTFTKVLYNDGSIFQEK